MKVGIIGPQSMAMTWEQHLRFITDVHEAVITTSLSPKEKFDACLILAEAAHDKTTLAEITDALKHGCHILWVAPLPTDHQTILSWHEAADEAGSVVMFSMWSHYAPTTRWLFNHIAIPRKIHIHREWPGPNFAPNKTTLQRNLLEEISLCLEWTKSRLVQLDGVLPDTASMLQYRLQFANDATATILLNAFGLENRHSRFVTGDKMAAVCQINEQVIKKWLLQGGPSYTPEVMRFDYREPARHLLGHFLRSVRTGQPPVFGISELYHLSETLVNFSIIQPSSS